MSPIYKGEPTLPNNPWNDFSISTSDYKAFVTFTKDRKVIVAGDIYEAARAFWEAVREMLPPSWTMEVEP